ncbi:signal peptidase complex catalytic subunit SEC11A isoform X1 [Haemorhous mexicanus]|uniref:signal peptidase complex catalytic subunit SEC11A isoform X1 n=1 Tax=Haemorhous mexicanus TaxID=30427 RepID=UPI0028BF3950|nr:signal peptidase complex catalytic subunit SEC11A isoform X1 [Haemorhous mexicanus]XP_059714042.1 signal peptidase complex catalytic subunit SEC11A isoform X1 [Haemorhous mexicanus]XP_059714043.1 signal peptidase complex catalytic subunit SEC11A isoform X1 [Haemorhous mexicanus]
MLSLDFLDDVRRMNKRQLYYQVLNFGMIVSSALMIWKGLMVVTGSESPIVVVLSGSMEPAFHRGDLLFLTNRIEDPIRVGEIVVFRIEGREIPIVHRVLKIHEKQNGDIKFLTKGDNNAVDDRGLYKQGQHWLEKKDVVGRARGFVPYIGIVTILMNDYPKFKELGKEQNTLRVDLELVEGVWRLMGKGSSTWIYQRHLARSLSKGS